MRCFSYSQLGALSLFLSFFQLSIVNSFVPLPSSPSLKNFHLSNTLHTETKNQNNPIQWHHRTNAPLQAISNGGEIAESPPPKCPLHPKNVFKFADKNFFVLGMAAAVFLAKLVPQWGMDKGTLRPELLVGKLGVTFVFLLSGLSLELSELKEAINHHSLNVLTQLSSFVAWPFLLGVPLVSILEACSIFTPALRDGILILTTLPTTVNMCVILTSAASGNVATALCNAVLGNSLGIFATPALLLHFFGTSIALPFGKMVGKLASKVLAPVVIGQILRQTPAKDVYESHSKKFKRFQEIILLGIVWNAFSNAFSKGVGLDMKSAMKLLLLLSGLHIFSLTALYNCFKIPKLGLKRGEVVAATFCASHKTLAFGLPLIKTVFDGNPNLASYCAPIMLIHPLQLILGSLMVPEFSWYISEEERNI